MRFFAFQALVLVLLRAALVVAAGPSHGAELIVAYLEYLADQEVHKINKSPFQIAPGCVGKSGPCTLKEFALYVFAMKSSTVKPTDAKPWNSILDSPLDHSIGDLNNALNAARVNVKDGNMFPKISDAIAPKAFKPSVTSYTQMAKTMGQRITDMSTAIGSNTPSDGQKKIMTMGKDAVQAALELRFMDIEKFRIPALRKLNVGIVTKIITIGFGINKSFASLDKTASIAKGMSGATLDSLTKNYKTKTGVIRGHFAAYKSTKVSAVNLGCKVNHLED